ncbi:MAG: porin family protein [Bacteroidota bacterium]
MKRYLLLILFVTASVAATAQQDRPQNLPAYDYKRLHFGFTVGVNTMDFSIRRNTVNGLVADVPVLQPGFQVNIVSDLRLNDDLNLRFLPGINFGQRDLTFYDGTTEVRTMVIESSYIDFPLLLKYRANRLNNCRPYVLGGLSLRYDMSARREYDMETNVRVRLKPADLYLEVGFGLDTYLTFFKFAPEVKLAVGTMNILVPDPEPNEPMFVEALSGLNAFIMMLNFHFE